MVKRSNAKEFSSARTPRATANCITERVSVSSRASAARKSAPRTAGAGDRRGKSFKTCECGLMAKSNHQYYCIRCGPVTKWSTHKSGTKYKRRKKDIVASLMKEIARLKKKERVQRVKRSLAISV